MSKPILLNSCARAATAEEARFRLPILERSSWRSTRVIALDEAAAEAVRRIAAAPWRGARFFTVGAANTAAGGIDVELHGTGGAASRLSAELDDADLVVLIATAGDGAGDGAAAAAASAIGMACDLRGIMTAGLILDQARTDAGGRGGSTASALRPHARVLLVTRDEQDVTEVLVALRA